MTLVAEKPATKKHMKLRKRHVKRIFKHMELPVAFRGTHTRFWGSQKQFYDVLGREHFKMADALMELLLAADVGITKQMIATAQRRAAKASLTFINGWDKSRVRTVSTYQHPLCCANWRAFKTVFPWKVFSRAMIKYARKHKLAD